MPVYFIGEEDKGYCCSKIGVAKDIEKRRRNLQTGNPSTIRLLGWINTAESSKLERHLHGFFAATRVRGEWFAIKMQSLNILAFGNGVTSKSTSAAPSADAFAAWHSRMHLRCITASTAMR